MPNLALIETLSAECRNKMNELNDIARQVLSAKVGRTGMLTAITMGNLMRDGREVLAEINDRVAKLNEAAR